MGGYRLLDSYTYNLSTYRHEPLPSSSRCWPSLPSLARACTFTLPSCCTPAHGTAFILPHLVRSSTTRCRLRTPSTSAKPLPFGTPRHARFRQVGAHGQAGARVEWMDERHGRRCTIATFLEEERRGSQCQWRATGARRRGKTRWQQHVARARGS